MAVDIVFSGSAMYLIALGTTPSAHPINDTLNHTAQSPFYGQ